MGTRDLVAYALAVFDGIEEIAIAASVIVDGHGSRRRATRAALVVAIVAPLAVTLGSTAAADPQPRGASSVAIEKTASVTEVDGGVAFSYDLNVRCANLTSPCRDTVVTDVLPPELDDSAAAVVVDDTSPLVQSASYDEASRTATWVLVNPLPAGTTGTLNLTVRFPTKVPTGGTTAVNTATVSTSNVGSAPSNPSTVTARPAEFGLQPDKTLVSSPALLDDAPPFNTRQTVTYRLRLCQPPPTGGLDLVDADVVDTLPASSVLVSATNRIGASVVSTTLTTVTWEGVDVSGDVGCGFVEEVAVRFPATAFSGGTVVTNSFTATGVVEGTTGPSTSLTADVSHPLELPSTNIEIDKEIQPWVDPDLPYTYRLRVRNTGSLPVPVTPDTLPPYLEIFDDLPAGFDLWTVGQEQGKPSSVAFAGGSFTAIPATAPSSNTPDVTIRTTLDPQTEVVYLLTGKFTGGDGTSLTNSASGSYIGGTGGSTGPVVTPPVEKPTVVYDDFAVPIIDKSVAPSTGAPGDVLTWTITVRNDDWASASLTPPFTVTDAIAPGLTLVPGSLSVSPSTAATVASSTSPVQVVGTDPLDPGESFTVTFQTVVQGTTPPGPIQNTATLDIAPPFPTGRSFPDATYVYPCDSPDLSTCPDYEATETVNIKSVAAVESDKWVSGVLDPIVTEPTAVEVTGGATWVKYPNVGVTPTGGTADYRLLVRNTGNTGVSSLVIVDVLPIPDDTAVISPETPRASEWSPNLVGAIELRRLGSAAGPDGFIGTPDDVPFVYTGPITIEYSKSSNPCRPTVIDDALNPGCDDPNWLPYSSLAGLVPITEVGSVRITLPAGLSPGVEVELRWPMLAPVGVPKDKIAWNSFAYVAARADNGASLLPSEPVKVGFRIGRPLPVNIGNYVWHDLDQDGFQDPQESQPSTAPPRLGGMNGVLVRLMDPGPDGASGGTDDLVVDTTITGPGFLLEPGFYLFPGLTPGKRYFLLFDALSYLEVSPDDGHQGSLPIGYRATVQTTGTTTGSDGGQSQSAAYPGWYETPVFAAEDTCFSLPRPFDCPNLGQADPTWDMGYTSAQVKVSLGDYVWEDTDLDGQQGSTEPPVANVPVTLWWSGPNGVSTPETGDDVAVATTTTSSTGSYLFDWLVNSQYYVCFDAPTGYAFTKAGVADTQASSLDSNAARPGGALPAGCTGDIPLPPVNEFFLNRVDAGLVRVGSLGDRVWEDVDADGVQDAGEPGLAGATVLLTGTNGLGETVDATATTDGNGGYLFPDLVQGTYTVTVVPPTGYLVTTQDATNPSTDTADSDVDEATGQTDPISLGYGQTDLTWDAGLFRPAAIGDLVWEDLDGDGTQDAGEPGVGGLTVTLTSPATGPLTTTTNVAGQYLFANLRPSTYTVTFTKPATWEWTYQDVDGDTTDSDALPSTGAATATVLSSGENDTSWDAGIYRPAALGDRLWLDADGDGLQGAAETGVAGQLVELLSSTGTVVASATTTSTGGYHFTGLRPGDYQVRFTAPASHVFTQPGIGTDRSVDSDVTTEGSTLGLTASFALASGADDPTRDAGVYVPAALGDVVWVDVDGDGTQGSTEPGLAGVGVELVREDGTVAGSTTTGASGQYRFDPVRPSTYTVRFAAPSGYVFTTADVGTDSLDSDAGSTGSTTLLNLGSGEVDLTWDAGLYQPATLGDLVWEDVDADGVFEAGEPGVAAVMVELLDSTGTTVATTTTNGSGQYLFTGLQPGTYSVRFVRPALWQFTAPRVGSACADSDADTATGDAPQTVLVSGEVDVCWDAGLYRPASIGDLVWEDVDGDGVQDAGEPGVPGLTVDLLDATGATVASTTTSSTGESLFEGLVPSTYSLRFTKPATWAWTLPDAGADGVDSDVPLTGPSTTVATFLVSGEADLTWDAGIFRPAAVGDLAWEDVNGDGVQDAGEPPVPGVGVELLSSTGTVVATATTTSTGSYRFAGLRPGTYRVRFTAPGTYAITRQDATNPSTDSADSDALAPGPVGATADVVLPSGADDPTWDVGLFRPVRLGDYTWFDVNRNGLQDTVPTTGAPVDEPPLGNVGVRLLSVTNGVTAPVTSDWFGAALPTTSDASGAHLFAGLPPGQHEVCFVRPDGYAFSLTDNTPGNEAVNSDADATDPLGAEGCTFTRPSPTASYLSGDEDLTIDAGFRSVLQVGNFVWDDLDADGVQDAGEPGIAGVTVQLDGVGLGYIVVSSSTTTDANGGYLFSDLLRGTYRLTFTAPGSYVPTLQNATGVLSDSDPSTATGQTASFDLVVDDPTRDAGFYRYAEIGDRAWFDTNLDGVQDDGEADYDGLTVRLSGIDGTGAPVSRTTTTVTGNSYSFAQLVPGTYRVTFDSPASYAFTRSDAPNPGGDTADSDAVAPTGQTTSIVLISGQRDLTWDAGYFAAASLGDYVWRDDNRNGLQDAGEPPVPGVGVTLNGSDVFTQPVALTGTTDASGRYVFRPLAPGTYVVTFSLPAGYGFTTPKAGSATLDSDADPSTGRTAAHTVAFGQAVTEVDAGLYLLPPPPPPPPTTSSSGTTTTRPPVGATTTVPSGQLPGTGSDSGGPVAWALVLIALGAGVLLVRRRFGRPSA